MHKVALAPILTLVIGTLLYSSIDRGVVPEETLVVPEATKPPPPHKPFRPEWAPSPGPEGILQGKLTEKICVTPNCKGCALDRDALFRKKPGHPKFQ